MVTFHSHILVLVMVLVQGGTHDADFAAPPARRVRDPDVSIHVRTPHTHCTLNPPSHPHTPMSIVIRVHSLHGRWTQTLTTRPDSFRLDAPHAAVEQEPSGRAAQTASHPKQIRIDETQTDGLDQTIKTGARPGDRPGAVVAGGPAPCV